jgi:hypothetical protein
MWDRKQDGDCASGIDLGANPNREMGAILLYFDF